MSNGDMNKFNHHFYDSSAALLNRTREIVLSTDIAIDLGCGIVPMNYFRPKLHIMVEPWDEYFNILVHRHVDDKSVLPIKCEALEFLTQLPDNSVDSVFLLDVIEHLEKDVGYKLLSEIERVCRQQALVFTPYGFMPQHMEPGELDGWGLGGAKMQEHKSGWLPDDFSTGWEFHICDTFHAENFRGDALDDPYGAFFAIRNFVEKPKPQATKLSDFRRLLPSELALQEAEAELDRAENKLVALRSDLAAVAAEKDALGRENDALLNNLTSARRELEGIKGRLLFKISERLKK
jgi:hypothetical protein